MKKQQVYVPKFMWEALVNSNTSYVFALRCEMKIPLKIILGFTWKSQTYCVQNRIKKLSGIINPYLWGVTREVDTF